LITRDIKKINEVLNSIGFNINCIGETILTTWNSDGSINAAPMGVIKIDENHLEVRPYKSSQTFLNLIKNPKACVNITNNPELFLVTAFKKENLLDFSHPTFRSDLSIEQADASIFLEKIESRNISNERISFIAEVSSIDILKKVPAVMNRGKAQAVEAIIYATRIEHLLKNKNLLKAEAYIIKFNGCRKVIERVSSVGSPEAKVLEVLEILIENWRIKFWR
jgi:hypothetical protein